MRKTTVTLALVTLLFAGSVYYFETKNETEKVSNEASTKIISFDKDQINFIEIQKNQGQLGSQISTQISTQIILQKNEDGWTLLEPIQDAADNDQVENLLEDLTAEKYLTVAKEAVDISWVDFGLEVPYASFNFKNNLGQSQKINIGTQKNFEGNPFIRIDAQNRVLVAAPIWHAKAEQTVMAYREKRLYRSSLGSIEAVRIKSLQEQFEIKKVDGKWILSQHPKLILDQEKVKSLLRQIAETTILDYIYDGEPSDTLIVEKKLNNAPIRIEFQTTRSTWAVQINQSEKENAIFAITDRPTNLLKLEATKWELFGNLSSDSLRDRSTPFRFNLSEVAKISYKDKQKELQFSKESGKDEWRTMLPVAASGSASGSASVPAAAFSTVAIVKEINKIHDLELSEFLDLDYKKQVSAVFTGGNVIILKSVSDNLIMQINWGPEIKLIKNGQTKSYYLTRTNKSDTTFAVEKHVLDGFFNGKTSE